MMKKYLLLAIGITFFLTPDMPAQGKNLTLFLKNNPNRYIRFSVFNQIWFRFSELNPGSVVDNIPQNYAWSVVNRRLRLRFNAQLHKRYMIVTHIAVNNQTFNSGGNNDARNPGKNPFLYVHEAWNEYAVILPEEIINISLAIGAGLHYWTGLSRITQASSTSSMILDYHGFNFPTLNTYDQFSRRLGIYIKGYIRHLNYIFNCNKPFTQKNTLIRNKHPIINEAVLNNQKNSAANYAISGYINYDFLEHESMKLAGRTGSYVNGNRKFFSIGGGYYYQPDASISQKKDKTLPQQHPIILFATDFFLNYALGKARHPSVFNAYGVYYHYNFGPNYIRSSGIANVSHTNTNIPVRRRAVSGAGIAQPAIGTGQIIHFQTGYLFSSLADAPIVRFQAFIAYYLKNFDYYAVPAHQTPV